MRNQKITYHTLPNSLRLVHRQVQSPVAYIGIMIGAGTRDEMAQEKGMAHFIEHAVFKGSEHRTARQIIDRLETIGGEINAFTTKEETTFYCAVPTAYTQRAIELLHDMVCTPAFPAEEIKKELNVIYDEIESYNDSPSELIYDDFENLIFHNHPLENQILGTKQSIRHFNSKKAKSFISRTYRTSRMVFFVQNSWSSDRVQKVVEQYWEATPFLLSPIDRQAPDIMTANQVTYNKHTHQNHIMLGGRAYHIGHQQQTALFLLNNILGGGSMNSRLNLLLREQYGLVYTVESSYSALSDTGYWSVYFATEANETDQCIDLVLQQLKNLKENTLSATALSQAKKQSIGQLMIAADNQENSVLSMAKQVLYLNNAPTVQQTAALIDTVTASQLREVANEVFDTANISTLMYL